MPTIAVDTETTGLDFRHGARPFYVNIAHEDGSVEFWEWEVDPLTRAVSVPKSDLTEIEDRLRAADTVVFHNAKFDLAALTTVIPSLPKWWDWEKTHDTLYLAHLLGSNLPKDLTALAVRYLGIDIEPYEVALDHAVAEARRLCRRKDWIAKRGEWRIAKQGLPEMPSAKEKCAKFDLWLPRAIAQKEWENSKAKIHLDEWNRHPITAIHPKNSDAWRFVEKIRENREELTGWLAFADWCDENEKHEWARLLRKSQVFWTRRGDLAKLEGWEWCPPSDSYEGSHPWWTVLQEYANPDPTVTLALFGEMSRIVRERKLERIADQSRKLIPCVYDLERRGVTANQKRIRELIERYRVESEQLGERCVEIARGYDYDLTLPKSGNNKSLTEFCFGRRVIEDGMLIEESQWLALPVVKTTENGAPSLDKGAMDLYAMTLDGDRLEFVESLGGKRSRDTGVSYLEGYGRFSIPVKGDTIRLHPSYNATGTDTLRLSSQNPNGQNVSAKEGFNLRYGFGPAPGREWWVLDAKNIERRLAAYDCEETAVIELFERPDEPPYFGSEHLLVASILFPREFGENPNDGNAFKKNHKAKYKRVKGFNFAVQYGAVDKADGTGTADRTIGIPGAHAKLKSRFVNQERMNRRLIDFANRHGYVETIPDMAVDPSRGYPILCARTEYGRVLETVPFNYRYQSSAMWWMRKAQVRCREYLRSECRRAFMAMQVHDELVFDFPAGRGLRPWMTNAVHVREIRKLMEQGGADFGIPTPVNVEYCADHWDDSRPVDI